ncbi:MAG: single-stranded DNA-binding protein [Candidatus Eisenbacteria bacterium]
MSDLRLPEVNRVMLSGRLTREPDKRYAPDATPVTSFDLAFHRRYRNRDGSASEQTGFVPVITYQRLAEVCGEYLHKGSAVLIEGRLQMRTWEAEKGERRTRLEIRADNVHFLDRRSETGTPPAGEVPVEGGHDEQRAPARPRGTPAGRRTTKKDIEGELF